MKPDVAKLRQTILQLAVEGKLVPQDPSEEPASVLLKQMEAEKQYLIADGKIRKSKTLPQIEDTEKPFKLPDSWEWCRLGELSSFINGDRGKNYPSKSAQVSSGVPFINAGHLVNGSIDLGRMNYITEERYELLGDGKIQLNDLLYCLRGSLGKVSLVDNIPKGVIASSLVIIRPHLSILNKYLYQYLTSPLHNTQVFKYSNGTAQPNLSAESVKKYIVPLPPKGEIQRIINKIEELMALCDELETKSDNFLVSLNKLRQTILRLAVEGRLLPQDPSDEPASKLLQRIEAEKKERGIKGKFHAVPHIQNVDKPYDVPSSWEWTTLGEYTQIIGGGTPRSGESDNFTDSGIAWLTPADLSGWNDMYISRGRRDISEKGFNTSSARLLPQGTVLFTSRAPIGYVALAANEVTTNQGFKSFVPYIMESNKYLYYYLKYAAKKIDASAPGTTFKEVSGARLATELLPVPPLEEQKRIVSKVEELLAVCDELEKALTANLYEK